MFRARWLESLRSRIISSYSRNDKQPFFNPQGISTSLFISEVAKWLQYANIPYAVRNDQGIYYPEDYVKNFAPSADVGTLDGLTHLSYWNIKIDGCFFQALEGSTPSEALSAFFSGPTFAECGNVLQACIYRAIEEMVGTQEFNRIFGAALTPFLITQILYNKIYSAIEKPDYSLDFRSNAGNPLLFLFDVQDEDLTESEIQLGDILYIKGVDKYGKKHLSGDGTGWNVICVGKNAENENLYLGFGPDSFNQPLTYKQIKSLLTRFYNEQPSAYTKKQIEKTSSSVNKKLDDLLATAKAYLADALSSDTVGDDYPIVGIQYTIRFNPEKLRLFCDKKDNTWHAMSVEELEQKCVAPSVANPIREVSPIGVETRGKTFADFEASTQDQIQMLSAAKKFALAVCTTRSTPVGLMMTGEVGIGKSHLAAAVADFASKHGKKVVYMNGRTPSDTQQKLFEYGTIPAGGINKLYHDWLKDVDLIVIDGVNSSIAQDFLKKAIKYAISQNKAFFVIGNKPLEILHKCIPDYIGYDDENSKNILRLENMHGHSYRHDWWASANLCNASGKLETNADALEILANLNVDQPAAIVLEVEDVINLDQVCEQYSGLSKENDLKIRILSDPYRGPVYDLYVHDFDQHDVFVCGYNGENGQSEQLLYLVSRIHDHGKKLIIVTNDFAAMKSRLDREIHYTAFENYQKPITDRLNHLLLKKSEWANVKVNAQAFTPGDEHRQVKITREPKRAFTRERSDGLNSRLGSYASYYPDLLTGNKLYSHLALMLRLFTENDLHRSNMSETRLLTYQPQKRNRHMK